MAKGKDDEEDDGSWGRKVLDAGDDEEGAARRVKKSQWPGRGELMAVGWQRYGDNVKKLISRDDGSKLE